MVSHHARLAAITMSRLILFLDFDGTLTPIVSSPNRARLSRPVRETLRKLVGLLPVVVISGRAPKDLRRRVGLQEVCYGGHRRAAWRGR
jgi:trehalose-phosphatase